MSDQRTLEDLEALKQRLEYDIRRSTNLDPGGLTRNSPLMRNYDQVQRDIAQAKTESNNG
jgi:hypothetical protein